MQFEPTVPPPAAPVAVGATTAPEVVLAATVLDGAAPVVSGRPPEPESESPPGIDAPPVGMEPAGRLNGRLKPEPSPEPRPEPAPPVGMEGRLNGRLIPEPNPEPSPDPSPDPRPEPAPRVAVGIEGRLNGRLSPEPRPEPNPEPPPTVGAGRARGSSGRALLKPTRKRMDVGVYLILKIVNNVETQEVSMKVEKCKDMRDGSVDQRM